MSLTQLTIIIVVLFVATLFTISVLASKQNVATPDDYYVGGRKMGAIVLLMTMGATFFSTWTLLGAFGNYYREGIWFIGFAVWTIFHAMFIWLFGTRIWMAGKRFNFVTPGEMVEHYYKSKMLRVVFTLVSILNLVPYMLIQVTGGALALEGLTSGGIPYFYGVSLMSLMVGLLVLLSGFRGAAWTDTFMGVFFGSILVMVLIMVVNQSGGIDIFRTVAEYRPEIIVNNGNIPGMFELMLGLGLGFWVMPHMWQKFYAAKSPLILGKTSLLTPLWNSWIMAIIPLFVGVAANIPGVVPGLSAENGDQLIPVFFSHYAPYIGTVVVAGIVAAAMSTINSQLLSSASIFVIDIGSQLAKKELSPKKQLFYSKIAIIVITLAIFILALMPAASGYLVPIAAVGFAIGIQLVPTALGMLYWKSITATGALTGMVVSLIVLFYLQINGITFILGPGAVALTTNFVVTWVVSLMTQKVSEDSIMNYHGMYRDYLKN